MNDSLSRAKDFWASGMYGQSLRELVIFLFAVDSIGSIFSRGAIWFGIAIAIIAGVDTYDKKNGEAVGVKTNVGLFVGFLIVGGVLMYLLFGFAPYVSTAQAAN
jgi:hypothetical protein